MITEEALHKTTCTIHAGVDNTPSFSAVPHIPLLPDCESTYHSGLVKILAPSGHEPQHR